MSQKSTLDSTCIDGSNFRLVKFGGSSIASPKRLRQLIRLIESDKPVFVVLSALFGTTDRLLQLVEALKKEDASDFVGQLIKLKAEYLNFVAELFSTSDYTQQAQALVADNFDRIEDYSERKYKQSVENELLAFGEQLSSQFLHLLLQEEGLQSRLLQATEFLHLNKFGLPDYPRIESSLKGSLNRHEPAKIYITQGFLCKDAKGSLSNLDRGGSDYTATILAAVLKVKEVEIWTDIDGVHNNDPRYVNTTFPLSTLSYDEASHLAFFGAKILHPLCIGPVKKANIPIRLKNTLKPSSPGTLIHQNVEGEGIKAIAAKDNLHIVKIQSKQDRAPHDFYKEVFKVLNKHKVSSDLIATSEESVSLAIEDKSASEKLSEALSPLGSIEVEDGLSAICIVGAFVKESKGLGKKIFESLFDIPLRMISYGGNRHHLALLIQSRDKIRALVSLNEHVFQKESLCQQKNYA